MSITQQQLLDAPWDSALWERFNQEQATLLPDAQWRNVLHAAGEKASQIRSFADLLIDNQHRAAQQKLDGLVTRGVINISEWQLLQIASNLWFGRIESAAQLSQDFLAAQPAGSSLASACHLLRKATMQGRIGSAPLINVLSGVFGFETDQQQASDSVPTNWIAPTNRPVLVPVHDRPGWKAVMACTENDPEARFYLEYYLSAIDGVVAIPRPLLCTGDPVVSIVIPVYNLWPLLQNCLKSIAAVANNVPFEVIVADDCSTDETAELLKLNPWVRHVRMETNGRFVRNCNNAAKHARGRYIYFLNNDTVVLDHWLDQVVATFQLRPEAGVVGSQVLFHNSEIQESGGIIWPDGDAWNFGRNFEKDKVYQVNYSREVDYISGCALAVERDLWEQVKGFGEEFIPGYCEDSDLCYKIRALGRQVWVQPQSRIIHFEGLSNSKDVEKGLKAYQKINLQKLNQKWKLQILTRGLSSTADILHASNYRLRTHKTVLVVDHYVPQPDKDSGSRTVQAFCEALIQLGYNVIFLPENYTAHQPYTSNLEALGLMVLHGNYVANHLEQILREQVRYVDCILFNRPHITKRYIDLLTEIFPSAKTLYYMHDMHGLREHLELAFECAAWSTPINLADAELLTSDEERIIRKVDLALTCSPKEEALLKPTHGNVVTICPYAIQVASDGAVGVPPDGGSTAQKDLLFVGGFGHTPNRLGIEWLVDHVLPLLDQRVRIHVVGSRCPDELKAKLEANPLIVFHGFVSDAKLEELLRQTAVSLAPLPYGAGIKGKVVEAFAAGHTVIGSKYGIEGIVDAPQGIYFTCGTAQDFASAIQQVFSRDRAAWMESSKRARSYVADRFNLGRIMLVFKEAIGSAMREPRTAQTLLQKQTETKLSGCTLMPASYGINHDGWLVRNNQLILAIPNQARELSIAGYLPESEKVIYQDAMEVHVDVLYDGNETLSFVQRVQPGMNVFVIHFPASKPLSVAAVELSPAYRIELPGSADRRELSMLLSSIDAS
jgi:GT2 family glycosyltransferase/glycosyltransferase involved in cell wall biosynthesis